MQYYFPFVLDRRQWVAIGVLTAILVLLIILFIIK